MMIRKKTLFFRAVFPDSHISPDIDRNDPESYQISIIDMISYEAAMSDDFHAGEAVEPHYNRVTPTYFDYDPINEFATIGVNVSYMANDEIKELISNLDPLFPIPPVTATFGDIFTSSKLVANDSHLNHVDQKNNTFL